MDANLKRLIYKFWHSKGHLFAVESKSKYYISPVLYIFDFSSIVSMFLK